MMNSFRVIITCTLLLVLALAPAAPAATITIINGDSGGRWTIIRVPDNWELYSGAPENSHMVSIIA